MEVIEMKKIILIFVGMVNLLSAWEVTTHRAIDRTALMEVGKQNLKYFTRSTAPAVECLWV